MINVFKSCCYYIPQRWIFAIMGFLALLNAYAMRVCLSITLNEMVLPINTTTTPGDHTCPDPTPDPYVNTTHSSLEPITGGAQFDWSEAEQGIILSSFYWGYLITHLPGGMLAERFGGKYSLGLGILSTAIFTLITPVVVNFGDMTGLVVLRVLMGFGEGTTFPALNAMLAQWTPPEERSKIGSLVFAGAQLGTVFANSISGVILHNWKSWAAVFYVFGGLGVAWFLVWVVLCYNNPREHPFISDKEANYLQDRMSEHTHEKTPPVPWRHILRSAPLWALIAAQCGHDWCIFTMITDLPKFMKDVMKFNIQENGLYSSLPYLCMWICSCVSSWFADWLIVRKYMSTTNVRKWGTTIASVGPAVLIVWASFVGCDEQMLVVVMFTVGMTLMGTFYPGMKVNALDLSPNYSGTLMAMTNGIGGFTGILTPLVVGELVKNRTSREWQNVFWIVLAVSLATNLIFVVWASGEPQPWNNPEFLRNEKKNKKSAKSQVNGNGVALNQKNKLEMA